MDGLSSTEQFIGRQEKQKADSDSIVGVGDSTSQGAEPLPADLRSQLEHARGLSEDFLRATAITLHLAMYSMSEGDLDNVSVFLRDYADLQSRWQVAMNRAVLNELEITGLPLVDGKSSIAVDVCAAMQSAISIPFVETLTPEAMENLTAYNTLNYWNLIPSPRHKVARQLKQEITEKFAAVTEGQKNRVRAEFNQAIVNVRQSSARDSVGSEQETKDDGKNGFSSARSTDPKNIRANTFRFENWSCYPDPKHQELAKRLRKEDKKTIGRKSDNEIAREIYGGSCDKSASALNAIRQHEKRRGGNFARP